MAEQTEAERRTVNGEHRVPLTRQARFRRRKLPTTLQAGPAFEHAFVAWVRPAGDGGTGEAIVTLMGMHHQVELLIAAGALAQIAAAARPELIERLGEYFETPTEGSKRVLTAEQCDEIRALLRQLRGDNG